MKKNKKEIEQVLEDARQMKFRLNRAEIGAKAVCQVMHDGVELGRGITKIEIENISKVGKTNEVILKLHTYDISEVDGAITKMSHTVYISD